MNERNTRVCPVELAGGLDNKVRRWLQDPQKILTPYVREGMTVLDLGCGPGFFSIELAKMVGVSGTVIAADLQEGMLQKLRDRVLGTPLEARIVLHKCAGDRIGVSRTVDLVLAFYMVHEIPDQKAAFKEIGAIIRPGGLFYIVEPKLFHVSKRAFAETLGNAEEAGFTLIETPKVLFSRAAVLRRVR